MEIRFGLAFDDEPLPAPPVGRGGQQYLGPVGLLYFLESRLGLIGLPSNNEYLRVEQYRQALRYYLDQNPEAFYRASFEADQLATAEALLQRRDELLLAGWGFQPCQLHRLQCLAVLEEKIQGGQYKLAPGYADRYAEVLRFIPSRRVDINRVVVHEPAHLLPRHFQRLFQQLSERGVAIEYLPEPQPNGDTDLGYFQRMLSGEAPAKRGVLKADGSILVIKAKRETSLATFFAKLLNENPEFRPACLIPEKSNTLDHAFTMEGLPSLGMLSASLARPTLQVLKLVTVFLWEPIDPFKIMEFVSLAVKPLDDELARRIANQMAQTPGLDGEGWRVTIGRYFNEIKDRPSWSKIREEYDFWFNRSRYPMSGTVPKGEVIEIFGRLAHWAFQCFEDKESTNNSLLVLSEQAKRVKELLEELPENRLSHLELERIVRTIYEPAPVQLRERQLGHLPYALAPGAIYSGVGQLAWWNFIQAEPQHFFSRWYGNEREYLEEQGVYLEGPADENERLIWHRKRPFLHAQDSILLLLPEMLNGQETTAHPLLGDLSAAFGPLDAITLDIDYLSAAPAIFQKRWSMPKMIDMEPRRLGSPRPFLTVAGLEEMGKRLSESFSSLNALFYYPYQWVFRHRIRLRKSSILSVVDDRALMGNLAHRMFEKLLNQEGIHRWRQEQVDAFIESEKMSLFAQEGAVMLMYGKEPERVGFIQRLKFSAWSLVRHIRENGWNVEGTELPVEGLFEGAEVKGRADLVLRRGKERADIDLKWRGTRLREEMIRNEEDLQLVMYSRLLEQGQQWAHTAYFIMEKGLMLARNKAAFQEVDPISPDTDFVEANQRILDRMKATYRWRLGQVKKGTVEIRCAHTESLLEEAYSEDNLFEILEMKAGDAPFDDYKVLINLIS